MILKETFASPLLKHRREGGEKKRQLHRQLQSFLRYTQTQKNAGWYSAWRESWSQEDAWRKNREYLLHIFINNVHFLIFIDKSSFKVTNLFIFPFMCIFETGLAANKCYESSKLTKKLVDSSA